MSHSLQICCVHRNDTWKSIGYLYFENERVVILLNNLIEKADLGPIKYVRNEHIEPEASIMIIPRNQVTAIEILQRIE
jgi:hypothetical protein